MPWLKSPIAGVAQLVERQLPKQSHIHGEFVISLLNHGKYCIFAIPKWHQEELKSTK